MTAVECIQEVAKLHLHLREAIQQRRLKAASLLWRDHKHGFKLVGDGTARITKVRSRNAAEPLAPAPATAAVVRIEEIVQRGVDDCEVLQDEEPAFLRHRYNRGLEHGLRVHVRSRLIALQGASNQGFRLPPRSVSCGGFDPPNHRPGTAANHHDMTAVNIPEQSLQKSGWSCNPLRHLVERAGRRGGRVSVLFCRETPIPAHVVKQCQVDGPLNRDDAPGATVRIVLLAELHQKVPFPIQSVAEVHVSGISLQLLRKHLRYAVGSKEEPRSVGASPVPVAEAVEVLRTLTSEMLQESLRQMLHTLFKSSADIAILQGLRLGLATALEGGHDCPRDIGERTSRIAQSCKQQGDGKALRAPRFAHDKKGGARHEAHDGTVDILPKGTDRRYVARNLKAVCPVLFFAHHSVVPYRFGRLGEAESEGPRYGAAQDGPQLATYHASDELRSHTQVWEPCFIHQMESDHQGCQVLVERIYGFEAQRSRVHLVSPVRPELGKANRVPQRDVQLLHELNGVPGGEHFGRALHHPLDVGLLGLRT
eukprot:scaffold942_cov260-Pinguiococcus_pyrenoidosus.AAC.4